MRVLASFLDKEYPPTEINHSRNVVRCVLLNEEGKILLHHLMGDDIFGHRDYFETPGGGIENGETFLEALKRECLEETGYEIEVLAPIGKIIDYYNLIHRKNNNYYFLAKTLGNKKSTHFVSLGDRFIKETIPVDLSEVESFYLSKSNTPLGRLLYQRETPVFLEARKIMQSSLFSCL